MSMYGPPGGPYPGQPQDPWQGGQPPPDPHDPFGPPGDPYGGPPVRDAWGDPPASPGPASYGDPGNYSPAAQSPAYGHAGAGHADAGHAGFAGGPGVGYSGGPGAGLAGGPGLGGPGPGGPGPGLGGPGLGYDGNFGGAGPAVPPGDLWGPARAPQRRGSSGMVVGVIAMLALVLIGSIGVAVFLSTRDDKGRDATANDAPSTSPAAVSSAAPPSAAPSSPVANAAPDAKSAKAGDCLVNKGTDEKPDLRRTACAPNTYQVLKRIDGTADKTKCNGTAQLTDWYFYDHPDNASDFVLCLRKR